MLNLDLKDKKLLYELSLNSRQPLSVLSKKIGLSRDFVNYRISRLVKLGVIKQFIAEIEVEKLGFSRNTIYMQFSELDKKQEEEIINKIINEPNSSWAATSLGKWNFIVDIAAKNNRELYSLIEDIKIKYGKFISNYKLVGLGEYYYFPEKYFGDVVVSEKKETIEKIDKTDKKILKLLSNEARLTNIEISKKLGLSPEAIRKRISKLEKNKTINKFTIAIDLSKIGLDFYNIQLVFSKYDNKREKELFEHLKHHKKVSFIYKPLSNWDIEFGLAVKNSYEANEELAKLRNKFSDLIKIHDSILLIDEVLPNIVPRAVLK